MPDLTTLAGRFISASLTQSRVRITYRDRNGIETEREIVPLNVVWLGTDPNQSFVYAQCLMRGGEMRKFLLHRIQQYEPT